MNESAGVIRLRSQLGLWIFLASEVMFFGPVFAIYAVGHFTLGPGFVEASRGTNIWLGTLNTGILLTSSLAVALADVFASQNATRSVRRCLDAALVLGLAFLIVKLTEYGLDAREGVVPGAGFHLEGASNQDAAELFFFVYFFSTLLHMVHLLIGLGVLGVNRRFYKGTGHDVRRLKASGLYWHFVDIVWIFLFPLLYLPGRAL